MIKENSFIICSYCVMRQQCSIQIHIFCTSIICDLISNSNSLWRYSSKITFIKLNVDIGKNSDLVVPCILILQLTYFKSKAKENENDQLRNMSSVVCVGWSCLCGVKYWQSFLKYARNFWIILGQKSFEKFKDTSHPRFILFKI